MTTRLANSVAQWREQPGADTSVALARRYWHYDVATTTWTITSDPFQESGSLADNDVDGVFVLTLTASVLSTAPVLRQSRRADGTVLVY